MSKPSEKTLEQMRADWDARAKENAFHYVESSKRDWTPEEFYASGREAVDILILKDSERIFGGRDPKQMTVLEIGCGAGRMTRTLAEVFGEVHALDISGEMIEKARQGLAGLSNVHLYHNNGTDLGVLPEVEFDLAFSFIVFQHIPESAVIESYIQDVARRLKPGALFKFQVQGYWRSKTEEPDSWLGCTLSARDILRIGDETGLRLEHHEGIGTHYFWLWMRKPDPAAAPAERNDAEVALILHQEADALDRHLEEAREADLDLRRQREALLEQIRQLSEQPPRETPPTRPEVEVPQPAADPLNTQHRRLEEELETSNAWARSLDAEVRSLREHLQAVYGSPAYRVGRRLGLAPEPIDES